MKALFEPPFVVHFFKAQPQDGGPKSFFFGTFELAILPEGKFPICIRDEVFDATVLYLDATSGHFVANLQFRTVVGCPPRERVVQHIVAYQNHTTQAPEIELDGL